MKTKCSQADNCIRELELLVKRKKPNSYLLRATDLS